MNALSAIVVFVLDERRFALPLAVVQRVVRAAEITPLPRAPVIVSGVINIAGRVVPVFDLRARFGLPPRALKVTDHLILARAGQRGVALIVDAVLGVREPNATETIDAAAIAPGLDYVAGVAKLPGGLVLIHDLATFLSLEEDAALNAALATSR